MATLDVNHYISTTSTVYKERRTTHVACRVKLLLLSPLSLSLSLFLVLIILNTASLVNFKKFVTILKINNID